MKKLLMFSFAVFVLLCIFYRPAPKQSKADTPKDSVSTQVSAVTYSSTPKYSSTRTSKVRGYYRKDGTYVKSHTRKRRK